MNKTLILALIIITFSMIALATTEIYNTATDSGNYVYIETIQNTSTWKLTGNVLKTTVSIQNLGTQQGIAITNDTIYVSFTNSGGDDYVSTIGAFYYNGTTKDTWAKDNHIGDMTIIGSLLYTVQSDCSFSNGRTDQNISIFNLSDDMALVQTKDVTDVFDADTDCVGAIGYYNNVLYVGRSWAGSTPTEIARYDLDLNFLNYTYINTSCGAGVQGIDFYDPVDMLFYTCHDDNGYFINLGLDNSSTQNISYNFQMQGIEYNVSQNLMWYNDRDNNQVIRIRNYSKIVTESKILNLSINGSSYAFEQKGCWICSQYIACLSKKDGYSQNRGTIFKCNASNYPIIRSGESGWIKNITNGETIYDDTDVGSVA